MTSLRILVFILGMIFLAFLEAHLYCIIYIGMPSPEVITHGVGLTLLILVLTCYISVIADVTETNMDQKLKELIRDRGAIAAIKYYRLTKGCKLKEAMEYIDSLKPLPPNPKSKTPCPYCGVLLRTDLAKQCFECGKDWH
jgi:hypothetical protein